MPFNRKPQKFNASIKEVTIGCGEKAVTLGAVSYTHLDVYKRQLLRKSIKCCLKIRALRMR